MVPNVQAVFTAAPALPSAFISRYTITYARRFSFSSPESFVLRSLRCAALNKQPQTTAPPPRQSRKNANGFHRAARHALIAGPTAPKVNPRPVTVQHRRPCRAYQRANPTSNAALSINMRGFAREGNSSWRSTHSFPPVNFNQKTRAESNLPARAMRATKFSESAATRRIWHYQNHFGKWAPYIFGSGMGWSLKP